MAVKERGKLNVTMVQVELVWEQVEENLERMEYYLKQVEATDLVVLPEMFTSGFSMEGKERTASAYEQVVEWMRLMARRKQALVMGSTVYREENSYYNRLLGVHPTGDVDFYDKRHCFTMGGEREHFMPGRERKTFLYQGVRIAPFVCYDLRFPVWSRNVEEYDLAVYVANWPLSRRGPWQILLKARAVENQAYVVGVNCVGTDGNGLEYAGDSLVISPRGEVLLACVPEQADVRQIDLDLQTLWEFRQKFPVLSDRDDFTLHIK